MRVEIIIGIFLTLAGLVFIGVGLIFLRSESTVIQEAGYVETLPLLTAAQLQDSPPGREAVLEASIAEQNSLYDNGFVAYIRSEYQGERCSDDDDGNRDCEPVWVEDERVTPALWLDLPGGRTRLANSDYLLANLPVTWQPEERLVAYTTRRYQGFKIGNPVFIKGVVSTVDGLAFKAEFIYGGNRQTYLTGQQNEAQSLRLGGFIFVGFGLAGLIAGGILFYISFK